MVHFASIVTLVYKVDQQNILYYQIHSTYSPTLWIYGFGGMTEIKSEPIQYVDSIHYAAEIGRLDFLSALLAIVAIGLGLAAIYSFMHFKGVAKKQARETAEIIAKEIAEEQANLYIQKELSLIHI